MKVIPSNPYYFLLTLIPLTMFTIPLNIPISGSIFTAYVSELLTFIAITVWIFHVMRKDDFVVNDLIKILLLFIAFSVFSIMNVTNIGRYLVGILTYVDVLLILLLFSNLSLTERQTKRIMKYFILSSLLISLPIIYITIIENGGNFLIGNKIVIHVGGSNYLASLLLIPFFILLTKVFNYKLNIMDIILLIITGVSIIFTASRTALVIMIVFTIAFLAYDLIFSKKISVFKKIRSLTFTMIAIVLVFNLGKGFISQMFSTGRFDDLSQQANLLSRFEIFEEYFNEFMKNPFFGNGYLNVNALGENYLAHNTILQILGDNGLFGIVLFAALLISLRKFLKKVEISSIGYLKAFVIGYKRAFLVVFVHGMLEPNFGTKLFMLYLFLGLGIILASYKDNNKIEFDKKINSNDTVGTNCAVRKLR